MIETDWIYYAHDTILLIVQVLAGVVEATTKPIACFQCLPAWSVAAGVGRGWFGRPLFLTPENQAQVDAARRGGPRFRPSSTALQGTGAAGAEVNQSAVHLDLDLDLDS